VPRIRAAIDQWKTRDPIERTRRMLIEEHGVPPDEIAALDADVEREMDEVVAYADASSAPDPETMHEHVYANPI
jgi:pyruvate dehydrogenase E1 component alpha subunit